MSSTETESPPKIRWPLRNRLIVVGELYRVWWRVGLILVALVGLDVYRTGRVSIVDGVMLAALVIPLLGGLFLFVGPQVEAIVLSSVPAADWDRLIRLLPLLREGASAIGESKAKFVTVFWHARALAGKGDADGAIKKIEELRGVSGVSEADCLVYRGSTLGDLGRYPEAQVDTLKAIDLDPNNFMARLMAAHQCAVRFGQPLEAREHIELAKQFLPNPMWQSPLASIEAEVLLAEGRTGEARVMLTQAMPGLRMMARRSPVAACTLMMARSTLCLACAKLGDVKLARKHLSDCRAHLMKHKEDDILRRCQEAMARL